ncbi:hypothetical protein NHG29_09595 [Aerococcaceae bacterium NML160702]|nr:hypothetical protein [Aerococcaceae bacterium NML160702]
MLSYNRANAYQKILLPSADSRSADIANKKKEEVNILIPLTYREVIRRLV